jgi:hypothetical protein
MVKRRVSTSNNADRGYTVGYRKPPIHSRFQPGQSGYPSGRRKGVRNLKTDVKRMLLMPVRVKEAGRMRKRSTQEAALMVLREKVLQAHGRALDRFFDLALRFNNDATEQEPAQGLAAVDQAILSAYVAECVSTAATPSPALAGDATPIRRRRLKRKGRK